MCGTVEREFEHCTQRTDGQTRAGTLDRTSLSLSVSQEFALSLGGHDLLEKKPRIETDEDGDEDEVSLNVSESQGQIQPGQTCVEVSENQFSLLGSSRYVRLTLGSRARKRELCRYCRRKLVSIVMSDVGQLSAERIYGIVVVCVDERYWAVREGGLLLLKTAASGKNAESGNHSRRLLAGHVHTNFEVRLTTKSVERYWKGIRCYISRVCSGLQ